MPSVLLIDDHPMLRAALCDMLGSYGFRVFVARTVPRALSLYRAHLIDLVLVDADTPELGGLEVCNALQAASTERHHRLRAVATTGWWTPELAARARTAGVALLLAKPFSIAELVVSLKRAMAGPPPTARRVPPAIPPSLVHRYRTARFRSP